MIAQFDRSGIVPKIPGIVLLSHGELALSLIASAIMIVGEQPNIAAFCFEAEDDPAAYREAFTEALEAYPAGTVVLTDLFSGTPCNQLMYYALSAGRPISAMSGMSLPMLLELVSSRDELSGQALIDTVEELAREGIVNISRRMQQRNA